MNIEGERETHNEKGALSLLVHISFCLMLGLSDNFQGFLKLLAQFPPLNCNYIFSGSVSELRSRHIGPYLLDLWALGSTEMKMADSEKAQEIVDAECLDEAPLATSSTPGEQDDHTKTETTTTTSSPQREKEVDIEGEQSLLSMPCLMKELRGESAESQHASVGSEKPASRHAYESDSSNPCMLSPSSSGHLADSDTLSSGEERAAPRAGEEEEGRMEAENDTGQTTEKQASSAAAGGRKSRRSHSESEMPPNAMAAKKNRCQPAVVAAGGHEKQTNGKLLKVKGHRSQKHKERMRLLRQKREAAARKKYNLLQDSSTSDSELTCDSSTSSSEDDDDDTSGGSKTIKTDISGNGQCTLHMLVTR